MTRAVDPFEEFLRKKNAEMLEEKARDASASSSATTADAEQSSKDDWTPPARDADPQADERLKEEMDDFFERSADAGAELFAQAQELDEDQVDEIKDALEDVFDAEASEPEVVESEDDTFIDFFKQVQTSFDPDLANLRREQALAREVVQPPIEEGAFEDEPLTAEFPPPEAETSAVVVPEAEPPPMPVESKQPFAPDPAELNPLTLDESDESDKSEVHEPGFQEPRGDNAIDADYVENPAERLNLAEILAPLLEGEDVRQRVEVLSRLLIKLVERAKLPESEIIEVLLKSGVEF